jgi:phosphoribosylformylglycinamidine cyclo-ligase
VAMNVNDLVCVGAEPIAMLDYLAVEQADPEALARIAVGLKVGAQTANVEIPGGELAVLPELIRGHPSPHGFDLCGTAFGTVALDEIVTGEAARPGDAIIGLPSSGLHSNGYTLARRALLDDGGLSLEDRPPALGGRSVADALLEPTVIYVRAALELLRSDIPVHGLAHITGGGLRNLLRLGGDRLGFAVEEPLAVPPICTLVAELGEVAAAEMWDVFNMGCGFVALVPEDRAADAVAILDAHHPGAARIGTVTGAAGRRAAPGL